LSIGSARQGRPATVFCEPQVQRRSSDPEAPSSLCQVSIAVAHLGQNCLALSLTQIPRDRRQLFPLPTLGPVLDRLRAEVLDGRGFALLRGMPVEDRPIAESATAYWGVGTYSAAPARRQMWVLMAHRSPLQPPAGGHRLVESSATPSRLPPPRDLHALLQIEQMLLGVAQNGGR
jgi:hypothetical protein